MDSRLVQELELLSEIYCDELEIKPAQSGVKLKVHCMPLLEELNIEHHYEYDNPFLYAIFDVPNEYPAMPPKIYLESTHSKVTIGVFLSELSDKLLEIVKSMPGESTLQDMIEYIRVASSDASFRSTTRSRRRTSTSRRDTTDLMMSQPISMTMKTKSSKRTS